MAQQPVNTTTSGKVSKNARIAGEVTQKFFCECGGRIEMVRTITNHKLRHFARCDKCKKTARKINMMVQKMKKVVIEKTIVEG